MATKDDLKNFATQEDLKRFATKDDVRVIVRQEIAELVPGIVALELKPVREQLRHIEDRLDTLNTEPTHVSDQEQNPHIRRRHEPKLQSFIYIDIPARRPLPLHQSSPKSARIMRNPCSRCATYPSVRVVAACLTYVQHDVEHHQFRVRLHLRSRRQ
jgi:hypothetical protein